MKKTINYILITVLCLIMPLFVHAKENDVIKLYFFHGSGCPHCAEEKVYLNSIKDQYPNFEVVELEVWYDEENSALLKKVEQVFEISKSGVPTNVIGDTIIMGYNSSTGRQIERAIAYYQEHEYEDVVEQIKNGTYEKNKEEKKDDTFTKKEQETDEEMTIDIPLFGKVNLKKMSLSIAAATIGLIDGFNPCAMWVLLFLISVLIGLKDRKKMWILGTIFLLTSGLFYMLIMLSWINVVVKFTTVVLIRNIIAIIAIIGAFINLKSFFTSKDSGCEVVDEKKRKKIFSKIKKYANEKSLSLAILGIMGLAISINVVELACSAGLPIIFSELLVINNVKWGMKIVYTFIYIIFFMLDDFIVFFIAMFTMKIAGISTKINKYSHLLGGIIMLLIGVLLLWHPEWLMFNFK